MPNHGSVPGTVRGFINTLRELAFGSITISVAWVISNILGMGANPKIAKAIVKSIPIDVIDDHSINFNSAQVCGDSVRSAGVCYATNRKCNFNLLGSPGRFLKHSLARILSVLPPLKGTCFRIVNKLLAKRLFGWENSRRSHSGVAVCDLGAFQSNELCDAPFFLQQPRLIST